MDLSVYCLDVRVHDSGHSYSNIDITIFRDHEPIRVEHTVTRCVALVASINNMRGSGTVHGYISRGLTNLYL